MRPHLLNLYQLHDEYSLHETASQYIILTPELIFILTGTMVVRLRFGIENELYLHPHESENVTEDPLELQEMMVAFYNFYKEADDIPLKVGENNSGKLATEQQIQDFEQYWLVAEDGSLGEASEYDVGGEVQGSE